MGWEQTTEVMIIDEGLSTLAEDCKKDPCDRWPTGYVKIAIEHDHRNSGFSHETW